MSVHSPTNVMLSISSSSFIATSSPARSVEPNVSLSIGSVFLRASSSLLICQPSVSRMQCGTGSFLPSWVPRYQVSWVSLVKSTVPSKVLIFSSTCGTIATASFLHIDYYQYFLHLLFFLHLCLNLIFAVCHCL